MKYTFRAAPNYRSPRSTKQIMTELTIGLGVVSLFAIVNNFLKYGSAYGMKAIEMLVVSIAVAYVVEIVWAFMCKKTIKEQLNGSFTIVTAIIFALTCPIGTPLYAIGVGSFFAIFFGKLIFGGFGHNIFNPAGVGRAVIFAAFSSKAVGYLSNANGVINASNAIVADAVSTVTPTTYMAGTLGWVVESKDIMTDFLAQYGGLSNLALGFYQGGLGETCALLIAVVGVVLAIRKVIDWRVPTVYLGTVFVLTSIISAMHGFDIRYPLFHLLTGGVMFGAVFMATDPVTNPTNPAARVVYGLGLGILTVLIRVKANLPEGVLYSILLMNMLTPLLDSAMNGSQIKNAKRNMTIAGVVAVLGIGTVAGVSNTLEAKEPALPEGKLSVTNYYEAGILSHEGNTYRISVSSFMGTNVVVVETDGTTISSVSFESVGDTPGLSDPATSPDFLNQFNNKAIKGLVVDAAAGATRTSESVMSAIHVIAHPEDAVEVEEEKPVAANKISAQSYNAATIDAVDGNVYTVSVTSFAGTNVVKVTVDGTTISSVEFVSVGDTPGISDAANTPDFLGQFVGQDVSSFEVDAASGATRTSESVASAVYAVSQN